MNFDDIKNGDQILSADGSLVVSYSHFDNGTIYLEVTDKLSNETDLLGFRVQWWQSFIVNNIWKGSQNSGDYIFRPATGQYTPFVYDQFKHATISNGKQMDFYFEGHDQLDKEVTVHVTIDSDTQAIKFQVDMGSLPDLD